MKNNELPMVGSPTKYEGDLAFYILNALGDYAEKRPIERRELIAALSQICILFFTQETPFPVKKQCEEIEDFCNFLKSHALKNAVNS